jgi:predicted nuclease of predicted toxin-antitoxin system
MDHQVDPRITLPLRQQGIDVLTAAEDGHEAAADEMVSRRATELGRVLVSFDKDFHAEASRCWATGEDFAGIICVKPGSLTIGQCIECLLLYASVYKPEEMSGRRVFLELF